MPNVSFDVFFDQDFINVTATRGKVAPKAKPEWKVRTAPKLPPKEPAPDHSGRPQPPKREKLVHSRQNQADELKEKAADTASKAADQAPKRKPPKLGPSKSAAKEQK